MPSAGYSPFLLYEFLQNEGEASARSVCSALTGRFQNLAVKVQGVGEEVGGEIRHRSRRRRERNDHRTASSLPTRRATMAAAAARVAEIVSPTAEPCTTARVCRSHTGNSTV